MFRFEQQQLTESFERLTVEIQNDGDRGVARELLLRDALARHLPARFGIGRGQVLDHTGEVSRQQDLVIFDRMVTPIIDANEAT